MVHRYQPIRSQASLRAPCLYKLWVVVIKGLDCFHIGIVHESKRTSHTSHVVTCKIFPVLPCSSFCFSLPSKQKQANVYSNNSTQWVCPACHFFSRFASRYTLKHHVLTSECLSPSPSNSPFTMLHGRLVTLHMTC